MRKMLITGGTVFVSRFAAEYFSNQYEVYVLNRNTKPQCPGVKLIEADRHSLGERLRNRHFDVILDITAYDARDVEDLLDAVGSFDDYILISSSAVYPETAVQPFVEETALGANCYWGKYGTDKIEAEEKLRQRVPGAYILRPPYLYGPGNNVYREAFVFECAMAGRPFYLPGNGDQLLQFYHVEDLCKFMEHILRNHPTQHIFNVGNTESVTIRDWVSLCYHIVGRKPEFVHVSREVPQRSYFPFYAYESYLDTGKQHTLMSQEITFEKGLQECLAWYRKNKPLVMKKPLLEFISNHLE